MEVRLLLPLVLLHGVTLFCAVNGDNMTEENIGDTQTVTPRPTTMQNITTPQCDHCPKKTEHPTTHHTTVLSTDHTTQEPSPPPKPIEYIVVNLAGEVCLRIKGIFKIMRNTTEIRYITFPSPPIPEVLGFCHGKAQLFLKFPEAELYLTFVEDEANNEFFLENVRIYILEEEEERYFGIELTRALVTPLGHLYTHKEERIRVSSEVSLVFEDVKVQVFEPDEGNFRGDNKPTFGYTGYNPEIGCIGKEITQCDNIFYTLLF
ncbi:uncharacterized protein LOC120933683 isoform X2 [Rana temporaria]|uniref:uncharacterized protein LOC120933683 isoform X2 n=1 Tax=Rana temporaria TaxID=8407 RepID=UPI001AACCD82|nr:uncharacterized protein LOC120933683 isoform X2 [Rana temporaria]